MVRHNIAAWTAPDVALPPYVSINRDGAGGVEITVRSLDGAQASATMTIEDWRQILRDANADFARNGHGIS